MKLYVCIAFALVASVAADSVSSSNANIANAQEIEVEPPAQNAVADLTRLRKSAYGGSAPSSGGYGGGASKGGYGGGASKGGYGGGSMPAPPCPKNYIFSCQPSLSPVACASSSGSSYGSTGAYSAPVPTYVSPLRNAYGVPQPYGGGVYVPQFYGYNNNNQYYQY